MTDTPSESVPVTRPPRPLATRLFIALVVALIVTGSAFWSGYATLRSPAGWVGDRRFVSSRIENIQEDLTKYHKEHEAYPETLRELYDGCSDDEYNDRITIYRYPVSYQRTDTGWQITVFGADGKPGGIGLDADLVVTNEMEYEQIVRELYSGKYNATFEQVRTDDSNHFRILLVTSLIFGVLVFGVAIIAVNSLKWQYISINIVALIPIIIAAIIVGGAIVLAHTVATGH
ncbi:MAG: hypothetical protein FWC50_10395 [Planctomycetaceae bacterium]|nr:hypothetical protein [Planctomycetaceae bacterium]